MQLETFAMRELNQPYSEIQIMPLSDLFQYAQIVQASVKEMEEKMDEAKSKLSNGTNKFRFRR